MNRALNWLLALALALALWLRDPLIGLLALLLALLAGALPYGSGMHWPG